MSEKKQNSNQLKLKKVVLFKSGIGSFQKNGTINLAQNKSVKISFKDTVINDLLKTFSILRLSGDLRISGVSYEAKETDQAKLLEDSDINLPKENSFSALLQQLRGIKVRIHKYDEVLEGRVLGMQHFSEAGEGEAIINRGYVLLTANNEKSTIQSIKIPEITGLEILNPKIKKDFQFFLEIITGQNKEKKKTVTIFFSGEQKSDYILNFLQEVPAWKTTYRIFLESNKQNTNQDNDESQKNQITSGSITEIIKLQAWAIIDNVLDEDWENVDLTLVSGLPISFIYDSYSPAWKIRPVVERETDLGVKVVQFDRSEIPLEKQDGGAVRDYSTRSDDRRMMARNRSSSRMAPMAPPSMVKEAPAPMESLATMDMMENEMYEMEEEMAEDAFEASSEAEGGKGLAMKYHINQPVYVKRNNSSLIPLLQTEVSGKLISVYNYDINQKYPITTLKFQNTDFTLEKGPISVHIDNIFAGEAMLPFLEKESDGKVPFSVDQSVQIKRKIEYNTLNQHQISVGQDIFKKYFYIKKTTYEIKNIGDSEKDLFIEHGKTSNFKIYDSEEVDEETRDKYIFNIKISQKKKTKLKIKERKLEYSRISSTSITFDLIKTWFKAKLINEEEFEYLKIRIELEIEFQSILDKKYKFEGRITDIVNEQARIRENIVALKTSESEMNLREKYIKKMEAQEDKLEVLKEQLKEATQEIQTMQERIKEHTNKWIKILKEKQKIGEEK